MRAGGFNERPHRVDIRQPAVLIDSDGAQSDVFILDVSSAGFRLQVSAALRVGEPVALRVERCDDFPAKIVWILGEEAGGVFTSPADHLEWESAGEAGMDPSDKNAGGDRRSGDRRQSEDRRTGFQRRQGGRTSDRRQGDRRKGERRE